MTRCSDQAPIARIALFFTVLLLGTPTAWAEPEESRAGRETVTLATSLITPFFGAIYFEGKLRASNTVAVVLNTSYLVMENDDDWKAKSGTLGLGANYYFQGDALRRWYVEAVAEVWVTSQRHEPSGEVAPVGLGYAAIALLGYEFVWDSGPVLDLGAGVVAFHLPSAEVEVDGSAIASEALTRVYPAAKVNVGWAF
ncbi:MAG TPA: hypothetical protein VFZ53_30755 [Polyangiaceae bacterium]